MAFAKGKSFVILNRMAETNPEAKKLLGDLNNISQEDFDSRFGKLLGNNEKGGEAPKEKPKEGKVTANKDFDPDKEGVQSIFGTEEENAKSKDKKVYGTMEEVMGKEPKGGQYKGLEGEAALKQANEDFAGYGKELDEKTWEEGSPGYERATKGRNAALDYIESNKEQKGYDNYAENQKQNKERFERTFGRIWLDRNEDKQTNQMTSAKEGIKPVSDKPTKEELTKQFGSLSPEEARKSFKEAYPEIYKKSFDNLIQSFGDGDEVRAFMEVAIDLGNWDVFYKEYKAYNPMKSAKEGIKPLEETPKTSTFKFEDFGEEERNFLKNKNLMIDGKKVTPEEFITSLATDLIKDKGFLNSFDVENKEPNETLEEIAIRNISEYLEYLEDGDMEFVGNREYGLESGGDSLKEIESFETPRNPKQQAKIDAKTKENQKK